MSKRYVFDTNVLVSAVLSARSVPRQAFNLAFARSKILLSNSVIEELNEVLNRPKFNRYLSTEKKELFLLILFLDAIFIDVKEKLSICRDVKDNKFLELAISGKANAIISGDNDLLVLNPFRNIPILNPNQFISQFPLT